jgi:hypothetical protein
VTRWSVSIILVLAAAPATAAERRCGWLANPTPSNYWFTDRDGEWTISEQGGYQADGMDVMPDMSSRGWIVTNGSSYGYGCACMTVETDRKSKRIIRIIAASSRPLKQCRADRHLTKR